MTVCMDANFGLVRKKNSGDSLYPADYADAFFLPTTTVDEFMDNYYEEKQDEVGYQ